MSMHPVYVDLNETKPLSPLPYKESLTLEDYKRLAQYPGEIDLPDGRTLLVRVWEPRMEAGKRTSVKIEASIVIRNDEETSE